MQHPAPLILAATALLAQIAHAQGVQYILDDGAGNSTIGPSAFDATMTWLNYFTAQEDGEIMNEISVAFGGIEDDTGVAGPNLVTVAILDDPNNDGDPADAVLLTTATTQWQDLEPNDFQTVPVAPVEVAGGFFVAVEMEVLQRANPARMDPQGIGAGSASWLFFNPESRLENLGNSEFVLQMSDSPFRGAWMIRASGRGCLADVAWTLPDLDLHDAVVFLGNYSEGSFSSDFTNDGVFDILDIFAFLDAFNTGCL